MEPRRADGRPASPGRGRRRLAVYAVLTAAAVVLSAVESMLPIPVPAPGYKLGLANTATLVMLLDYPGPAPVFAAVALRCVLTALLTGMFSALLFSLAGGLASCALMWLLLRPRGFFSAVGISVAGAACHNTAQIAVAALLARDAAIFGYLPVLLVAGTASGFATGLLAGRVYKTIPLIKS